MTQDELLALLARAKAEGWKRLDLAGMELDELPPEIGELTQLEVLVLGKSKSLFRGNNLTSLPGEIGQLSQLTKLDLNGNQLSSLPGEIGQLSQLTRLDLSHNQLSSLPEAIGQLSQLTRLDLSSNQLSSLPEAIGQLTQLVKLDLSGNHLSRLPEVIGQLTQLTKLDLFSNQLSRLPEAIGQLTQITKLDLTNNQLSELPSTIGTLSHLTSLSLSKNQLSELPSTIGTLSHLTSLSLSDNQLNKLPAEIGKLFQLTELFLSGNQLSELPSAIGTLSQLNRLSLKGNILIKLPTSLGQLSQLTWLYLRDNKLSELPAELQKLSQLTWLSLGENQLSSLPEWIRNLPNLKELYLLGNPIAIPPEILTGDRWYDPGDLETILKFAFTPPNETQPLYEAKLLIVGDGGAGKTSLANKLLDPNYQLSTSTEEYDWTRGIDILPWEIQHPDGHPYRVNIWDFGGQEIYHTTHQFFLSSRSVYVLVHDNRKGQTDFQYWLQTIRLLGENSPIVIVKNEKGDCHHAPDESAFAIDDLDRVTICTTNLATNQGLDDVRRAIKQALCNLDRVGDPLPIPWANIRAVLQNLSRSRNYIDEYDYFKYCEQNGFDNRREMRAASDFFHKLGICLHFQNERNASLSEASSLDKILILKPTWATDTIYKIFDNEEVKNDCGRFDDAKLCEIWDEGDDAEKRRELLALMKKFKLCYEIPGSPGRYIAPTFLKSDPPDYDWDDTDNLILHYSYPFKPKKLFLNFIVAVHEHIDEQRLVWRHGVVLRDALSDVRAEILEDRDYRNAEIKIRVSGTGDKRRFLQIVANELEKIQNRYGQANQFEYKTRIPCICPQCKGSQNPAFHDWTEVEQYWRERIYDKRCPIHVREVIDVRRLIDNIAPPPIDRPDGKPNPDVDPHARSSPFSPHISVIYQQPKMTEKMTENTGRTINTGGGDYREINNSGHAQYAEGNINNHPNEAKTPAEAAKEIQDLLTQLDLSPDTPDRRISNRIAKQDLDWQKRLWAALKSAAPELLKSGAGVALAPFGFAGAAAAGTLNVIVEATRGALEDEDAISADEPNPFDAAKL